MYKRLFWPLTLYALACLALSLWTWPALVHFVSISRNRPTLFGPSFGGHVTSGFVWNMFQLALWPLWFWLVRRSEGLSLRRAALMCIGLSLLFIPFGWRATSNDPMEYLLWGLAQAHRHLDPIGQTLQTTGSAFARAQSAWYNHPDPYGPLFWLIERTLGRFPMWAFEDLWRAICIVAYALVALLLVPLLKAHGETRGSILIALWASPMVLLETVAGGHNDILVALFIVIALVLWGRSRGLSYLGSAAFGLSIAIKPVFLLAAPGVLWWFWRQRGGRAAAAHTAMAVLAWAVWFIPYGSPLHYLFANLLDQGTLVGYGVAILARSILIPPLLVRLVGLVWLGYLWWRTSDQDLLRATGLPFLASLAAFTTWVEPWYMVALQPVVWLGVPQRLRRVILVLEAEYMCAYGITMAFGFKPVYVSLILFGSAIVMWRYADLFDRLLARRTGVLSRAPA